MIVCSCNRLSDGDVRDCLNPGPDCPRTPAQVYRCLGCSPECGHCARTIRSIMNKALEAAAEAACGACPLTCGHDHHHHDHHEAGQGHDSEPQPALAHARPAPARAA